MATVFSSLVHMATLTLITSTTFALLVPAWNGAVWSGAAGNGVANSDPYGALQQHNDNNSDSEHSLPNPPEQGNSLPSSDSPETNKFSDDQPETCYGMSFGIVKSCPPSCVNRCGTVSIASSDNLYPCHCDNACWLYGDCCIDYYPLCLHLNISSTSAMILNATLSTMTKYSQVLSLYEDFQWSRLSRCWNLMSTKFYIQIVVSCSSHPEFLAKFKALHNDLQDPLSGGTKFFMGLTQNEIKHRCEHQEMGSVELHPLDHTHVTLVRGTAIHFYNVFCAICNGITPNHLKAWTTDIKCNNKTLNQTDLPSLLFAGGVYQSNLRNNCMTHNLNSPTCFHRACFPRHLYEPSSNTSNTQTNDDAFNDIKYGNSPRCTFRNDTASNMCQRYQFVYKAQVTLYKNPHCHVCSMSFDVDLNDTISLATMYPTQSMIEYIDYTCRRGQFDCLDYLVSLAFNSLLTSITSIANEAIKDTAYKMPVASYRILFDFQSHLPTVTINQTLQTIETKTCPPNQVYVPLYGCCHPVHCVTGTRWRSNQCLPVDSCSEIDSNNNSKCYVDDSQDLDYNYLPFPDGSKYIKLNIALEYILNQILTSDSLTDTNTTNTNDDFDCDITRHNKYTQNSETCTFSVDSLGHLFTVSNLRKFWVEQTRMAEINSTELKQDTYNEIANNVRRLIYESIKDYIGTLFQIKKIQHIFCAGFSCFTMLDDDWIETDSYKKKQHIQNPCVKNPKRKYARKNGKQTPDVCLSFGLHLRSNDELDAVLQAAKTIVNEIENVAHDNNFLLSWLEFTNKMKATREKSFKETRTKTNKSNVGDSFASSSNELCRSGEVLTHKKTKIELAQNRTYTVRFSGTQTQLGKFAFNIQFYTNPVTSEIQVNVANISWCQVDTFLANCQSFQTFLIKPSQFIIYNGTLVSTNKSEALMQFLYTYSQTDTDTTVADIVETFVRDSGDKETTVVKEGTYIHIRSGVLVCVNFTHFYESTNVTFQFRSVLQFMPGSNTEFIATIVASALSITCLVTTLTVYSFMPSLRNTPGKIVMSLSATLLCAQVLFLCCQQPEGLACEIYASIHHAVWLAVFAWLAAMSVDLAYIVSIRSSVHIDMSRNNVFKLLSAVCWGVPCLVSGSCLALFKANLVSIGYGQNRVCWIGNLNSLLIVFGVPVFLVFAVTSVCAIVIVKAIRSSANFRSKSAANRRTNRSQLILCVNLSMLMGLNWVFYFLAVVVNNTTGWTLHILVNGSQGLFIFLCFVARKSLLSKVITKLKVRNIGSGDHEQSFGSPKTSFKTIVTTVTPLGSPCASANKVLHSSASPSPTSEILHSESKNL